MVYSFYLVLTIDTSLFFYYDDYSVKKIFDPLHVYISSLLASYCYLLCYKNIESLMVSDYFRTNIFGWKLSFNTFYTIGFLYSNVIFLSTEILYYFLTHSTEYLFHRILLIIPSTLFVLFFLESFTYLDNIRVIYVNRIADD
jgi:hypothetical protein